MAEGQQLAQGCKPSGGDEFGGRDRDCFGAHGMHTDRRCRQPRRFAQEAGFADVRFHQLPRDPGRDCQNEPGETSAAAKVDGAGDTRPHKLPELERVGDVPRPHVTFVGSADQVYRSVPPKE
jgi:hypothetical protein